MRASKFLIAAVAVLAVGLIAAGCGGDDDDQANDGPGIGLEPGEAPAPESPEDLEGIPEGELGEGTPTREQLLEQCRWAAEQAPAAEREQLLESCEVQFGE